MQRRNCHLVAAFLTAAILAAPLAGHARDYVVTPNGITGAAGTVASPTNLASAIDRAGAGDKVLMRGNAGIYTTGPKVYSHHGGSPAARLVIRSYWGERAVITPNTKSDCILVSGDWVKVYGLTCKDAPWQGVTVWGGNGAIIENVTVDGASENGILVRRVDSDRAARNARILNNFVTRACGRNSVRHKPDDGATGWPQGISLVAPGALAEGNTVTDTWGEGIGAQADNVRIINNVIEDVFSVAIYPDGVSGTVIEDNDITITGDASFFFNTSATSGRRAIGVLIAGEQNGAPMAGLKINRNTIRGADGGIAYGAFLESPKITNATINGNTITSPVRFGIDLQDAPSGSNGSVTNNAVTGAGSTEYRIPSGFSQSGNS